MHARYMRKSQIPDLIVRFRILLHFYKTVGIEKVNTTANDIVSVNYRSGFLPMPQLF